MMRALRLPDLLFEADDLHPIFAQRAVHRGAPFYRFARTLYHHVGHVRMRAQIAGLEYFQRRLALLQRVGCGINALDQHAIEQKERQHHETPQTVACCRAQAIGHERFGGARIAHLHAAETHAFLQHAGDLGDLAVGVRIGRAPAHQNQASLVAAHGMRRARFRRNHPFLRQLQQLGMQIERRTEMEIDGRMFARKRKHLRRQIVFCMAGREQHARHHRHLLRTERQVGRYCLAERRAGKLQIPVTDRMRVGALAHQFDQRLEFAHGIGIAAAMTGEHDTEWRRCGHRCVRSVDDGLH